MPLDDELAHLVGIFRTELTDYVQAARRNLTELERIGFDQELVHETFRCLHNLKGAAAAIGLESLSGVAHSMETRLAAVRKRQLGLSPELYALLYEGAELIERLLDEEDPRRAASYEARCCQLKETAPEPAEPEAAPAPPVAIRRTEAEETVRIPVAKLDRLIGESTQLLAQRARLERRQEEVRDLAFLLSTLARQGDAAALRPALQAVAALDRQLMADAGVLRSGVESVVSQAQSLRMLPLAGLFEAVGHHARDLARKQGKAVEWVTRGEELEIDRYVLESLKEPLLHLARNAVDHGLPEGGTVSLVAEPAGSQMRLTLRDDGVGVDPEKLRRRAEALGVTVGEGDLLELIFLPGFSTREVADDVSGRGVGLDVVRSRVERLNGHLVVESQPGQGTAMILTVPLSLSSTRVLVVGCGGQRFAVPLACVERTLRLGADALAVLDAQDAGLEVHLVDAQPAELRVAQARAVEQLEQRPIADALGGAGVRRLHQLDHLALAQERPRQSPAVSRQLKLQAVRLEGELLTRVDERAIKVQPLLSLLGQPQKLPPGLWNAVLLAHGDDRWLAVVDEVIGEEEVVVRPLGPRLRRLAGIAGGALEADGSVLVVLNVADFSQRTQRPAAATLTAVAPPRQVLVVDDSLTTRTLEKNLLEAAGYVVHLACDGTEGLAMARDVLPDLILSDIEMPRCNGFEFTRSLREDAVLRELPVILVSSLDSPEIFRQGSEAGANAYVVKGRFDQSQFLQLVKELIER